MGGFIIMTVFIETFTGIEIRKSTSLNDEYIMALNEYHDTDTLSYKLSLLSCLFVLFLMLVLLKSYQN